jgi:hypothetical protein
MQTFLVGLVEQTKVVAWAYHKPIPAVLRQLSHPVRDHAEVVEDARCPRIEKRLPVVLSRGEATLAPIEFNTAMPAPVGY